MEKVIDTHFHLWDLEANYYPWLTDRPSENIARIVGDYSKIRKNYLFDDFRKDIAGLNLAAAVHVQADAADTLSESTWIQSVADTVGEGAPQGFVAGVDLGRDDAPELIERLCAFPNMRGIRAEMHPGLNAAPDYDPLRDETWLRNFALLEQQNLILEVRAASPGQTEDVIRLMQANPNTNFVFPHLGLSIWRDAESIAAWKRSIKRFGEMNNVYVKLSGYGLFGEHWKTEDVRPFVLDCIEALGADKLVCGSNYPVDSIAASYVRIWDTHSALLDAAGCNSDERSRILHDNAKRLYRL